MNGELTDFALRLSRLLNLSNTIEDPEPTVNVDPEPTVIFL
jgi:hypothetical protein